MHIKPVLQCMHLRPKKNFFVEINLVESEKYSIYKTAAGSLLSYFYLSIQKLTVHALTNLSHFCKSMVVMKKHVYQSLSEKKQKGKKSFAVLIDPDNVTASSIKDLADLANKAKVDYLFVGGSLVITDQLDECI